nr:uncharacterized protein LOC105729647 [Aotus nancymaae]
MGGPPLMSQRALGGSAPLVQGAPDFPLPTLESVSRKPRPLHLGLPHPLCDCASQPRPYPTVPKCSIGSSRAAVLEIFLPQQRPIAACYEGPSTGPLAAPSFCHPFPYEKARRSSPGFSENIPRKRFLHWSHHPRTKNGSPGNRRPSGHLDSRVNGADTERVPHEGNITDAAPGWLMSWATTLRCVTTKQVHYSIVCNNEILETIQKFINRETSEYIGIPLRKS